MEKKNFLRYTKHNKTMKKDVVSAVRGRPLRAARVEGREDERSR